MVEALLKSEDGLVPAVARQVCARVDGIADSVTLDPRQSPDVLAAQMAVLRA